MSGAVLKFPVPDRDPDSEKKEIVFNYRQKPVHTTFTNTESKGLLFTAQRVYRGMSDLIEFVDSHRETAVEAGIETIAVELVAERGNLEAVIDTFEEGVKKDASVTITLEGLALMRRLEKLVAEASSNISRFTSVVGPSSYRPSLSGPSNTSDMMTPLIIFGVVAVSLVVVVALFSPKK
jgi:hypothetical protein